MTTAETAAMMELFRRSVSWEPLYNQKCASCHGVAITFARASLQVQGKIAYAPARNTTVREVLASHGGVTATEAETLADMLRDQIGGQ